MINPATSKRLKISVVIPAFNEEKFLPVTLAAVQSSLPAFHERGWETEVIVCDNNSTDRTGAVACAAGAKVVFEPMNQIAKARNTGVSIATGDWLLILDADSKPTREVLADVADTIASGRCILGGTTLRPDKIYFTSWLVYLVWNWFSRWFRWATGPMIFCERSVFLQLKGFDETLYCSEDINLSHRFRPLARQADKTIVILNRHPLVTSARKFKLYTWWDYIWFLIKVWCLRGRPCRNREECYAWYDGRR